jgi:hypothetical protein
MLALLGAAFSFGLARLYTLRFETGDVYPAYSSLRADPLGARALFESLGRLLPAERNYRPLARLDAPVDATVFWLGAEPGELEFPRSDLERLEAFIGGGGRLVIALKPQPTAPRFQSFGKPVPAVKKQSADEDDEPASPIVALTNRWKFSLAYLSLPRDERRDYQPTTAQRREDLPLPESLPVHTAVGFGGASNDWRVIYSRTNDHASLIERRLGRGSIVLCADAVPLSNEALLKDRQPDLLAWLTGPARRVIFDEAHLGVSEDPGVATLARRYRLHGLFAALLVLAGLYVWKSSSHLVPALRPRDGAEASDAVAGRDSAEGFVNLLRRSLPRERLLATCLEQWNADCLRTARPSQSRLEQMQATIDAQNALPPRQRDVVATYRNFVRILRRQLDARSHSKPETRNPKQPR